MSRRLPTYFISHGGGPWPFVDVGFPRDEGGTLAAKGRVYDDYVTQYLRHSYFGEPPPKSLDRNEFHAAAASVEPLSDGDAMATLAEFTVVASVAVLKPAAPNIPWTREASRGSPGAGHIISYDSGGNP